MAAARLGQGLRREGIHRVSVAATTWAWARPSGAGGVCGNDRLVLLAIADAADKEGRNAWPAIDTLASMAGLSRRTVQRSIRSLEKLGMLTVEKQAGGDKEMRDDQRPNRYTLPVKAYDGVTERHPVESGEAVDNADDGTTLLTPRDGDGVSQGTQRGDKSGHNGVTELCHPNKDLNQDRTIAPTTVDAVEIASLRDAVLDACEIPEDRITPAAAGVINRAISELCLVGATADEVPKAVQNYRKRFPSATLTPPALAKHWAQLGDGTALAVPALSEAQRFGISLGRSEPDRVEASDAIETQFEDAFDRGEAMTAWERTRHQEGAA